MTFSSEVTLADIRAAAQQIEGHIQRTPMRHSRTLSAMTSASIWLKFENLQYTASFKERGAFIKLASLSEAESSKGVIAMSAGNHAQGVAYHGGKMGIPVTIVMPEATPFTKVENTERLGARIVLHGETVDDAAIFAHDLAKKEDLTFIHPFDDPQVIAGQGTIAIEMLAAQAELEVLVVPIGGGGLIGGMAIAAKSINPKVRIIGVQASLFPSAKAAIDGNQMTVGGQTLADGIAVKQPGRMTLPLIERWVDDILLVDEPILEEAVLRLLEVEKTVAEGAGAAGLAAVLAYPELFQGRHVGLVVCGGNIDSRLLSDVILRGLVTSSRLIRVAIGLPDRPGALSGLSNELGRTRANIVDVVHRRAFSGRSVREAVVDLTLETRNERHATEILKTLQRSDYRIIETS